MSVLKNCDNELFDDMVLDAIDDLVFPTDSTFEQPLILQNSNGNDIKIQSNNGMFLNFSYVASQPADFIVLQTATGRYVRLGVEVVTGNTYDYIGTNLSEIRGPIVFGINNSSGEWVKFESTAVKIFIGDTLRFTVDDGKISSTHTNFEVPTTFSLNNASGESVGFTSSTVTLATDNVTRLTASSSALTCAVPIKLPTAGGTAASLEYYEELQISATNLYNYGTTTQACTAAVTPILRFRKIGKLVTMDFNLISGTKSATAAAITVAATLPTNYYPINNSIVLLASISSGGVFSIGSIEVTTAGVINISPTPQTLQTWNANTAFTVQKNCVTWATST